jgi:hypothetical protein
MDKDIDPISKRLIRNTRFINRRTVLKGTLGTVFGVVAGVSIGRPQKAYAAFPCNGLPNCRDTNPSMCIGHTCASGTNFVCRAAPGLCQASGNCWTSSGGQCCDCYCSACGGGCSSWYCICYG